MSYSLSHQGATVNGFPVSLISTAESGGGISVASITIPYATSGTSALAVLGNDTVDTDLVTDGTWGNPTQYEQRVDLTGMTEVRAYGHCVTPGPTGQTLTLMYSLDGSTVFDLTTGGLTLAIDAAAWLDTDWQPLDGGATGTVRIHPHTAGSDGVTNAYVGPLYLAFR